MGGGEDITITLSGQAAQRLRSEFPRGRLEINRKTEQVIAEWLDDRADVKAARESERLSKGKPNISADRLFQECGV